MSRRFLKFNIFIVCLTIISLISSCFFVVNAMNTEDKRVMPSGKIISIASSMDNTVVLMDDGSVWAWGDNSCRQLGEGVDSVQKCVFEPVRIIGLDDIAKIAVGNRFILALDNYGQVWGVGNNSSGIISSDINKNEIAKPVKVAGLYDISHISAGINYAVALNSDRTIWLWGDYRYKVKNSNRVSDAKDISDVEKIYALRYNTIAIDKKGTGWISRGKYIEPKQITEVTRIIDITEGVNFTYAVKEDGSVWSWNNFTLKVARIEGLNKIRQIVSVDNDDFVALDEEGFVWNWKSKGNRVSKNTDIANIVTITAGTSHFAALKDDNTVWSWGDNKNGQLGNGGGFFFPKPALLESISSVKQVSASKNYTVALKEDGTVWTWGNNNSGQLGNDSKESSLSPIQVRGLTDVEKVEAGISHVLALKKDGTVWSWGSNICGELGDGTYAAKYVPIQVQKISNVKDIAAGNCFSIAVKSNGSVWVWGNSGYGEDGDPLYKDTSVPAEMKNFDSAKTVSAGFDHGLALRVDRSAWAWGSNGYGQYGYTPEDSELKKRKAVKVPGVIWISQVSAGSSHNLALKEDGTVISWGNNDYGQLGFATDGRGYSIYSKLPIENFDNVAIVEAGYNNSFAVKGDGTLWAWGDNSLGQLGTGDNISSDSPVQVPGMVGIRSISAGNGYTVAAKQDGTVWVWGSNICGQLGIGKITKDYEKIPVMSFVN